MTTQEKLNKRRDELADKCAYISLQSIHCVPIEVYSAREMFNTLSPTWLKLYEALQEVVVNEAGTLRQSRALTEADKFLEGK